MSERIYVGKKARSLDVAPQFLGYTRVVLQVSDDLEYTAGTDTGRTLTHFNPFGTQQMCDNILAQIRGYAYQPFQAGGALLDPAAELGDGVTVNKTYSGIFGQRNKFGPLFTADLSAPYEEEIDHEFPYKSQEERQIIRQTQWTKTQFQVLDGKITAEVEARKADTTSVRAALTLEAERILSEVAQVQNNVDTVSSRLTQEAAKISLEVTNRQNADAVLQSILNTQAGEISAKVSKTGGNSSTFSWIMDDSKMVWYASGSEVFRLDKNGAQVTGKITATSGKIGNMDILNGALSYNQNWGGGNTYGFYAGPNGLQCGPWNGGFHVDNSGALYASTGNFSGTVYAGKISYGGGGDGYMSGSLLSGHSVSWSELGYGSVNTSITTSSINTSLSHAESAYDRLFNYDDWSLYCNTVHTKYFYLNGSNINKKTTSFVDGNGNTKTIYYLGW